MCDTTHLRKHKHIIVRKHICSHIYHLFAPISPPFAQSSVCIDCNRTAFTANKDFCSPLYFTFSPLISPSWNSCWRGYFFQFLPSFSCNERENNFASILYLFFRYVDFCLIFGAFLVHFIWHFLCVRVCECNFKCLVGGNDRKLGSIV